MNWASTRNTTITVVAYTRKKKKSYTNENKSNPGENKIFYEKHITDFLVNDLPL